MTWSATALARRVEASFWSADGSTGSPTLDRALEVGALGYELGVRLRNRAFDLGWLRAHDSGCPTVCIGNLTVGGSGKTPIVEHLAARLSALGERVAILSRGYGRDDSRRSERVALADPARHGDEPAMLSARLPGVELIVGGDRVTSARVGRSLGATTLVLDDGFQHRRLSRDLDIIVVDGSRGFGNGHLLPRGPLREPVAGLERAHLVLLKAGDGGPWDALIARGIRDLAAGTPVQSFQLVPRALRSAAGEETDCGAIVDRTVVAVSGVGNPCGFRSALTSLGARVVEEVVFRDHHRYRVEDAERLRSLLSVRGAELLVTTAKDLAKLGPLLPDTRLLALEVGVRFASGFDLAQWTKARLPAHSPER